MHRNNTDVFGEPSLPFSVEIISGRLQFGNVKNKIKINFTYILLNADFETFVIARQNCGHRKKVISKENI